MGIEIQMKVRRSGWSTRCDDCLLLTTFLAPGDYTPARLVTLRQRDHVVSCTIDLFIFLPRAYSSVSRRAEGSRFFVSDSDIFCFLYFIALLTLGVHFHIQYLFQGTFVCS